jgi:hypothetical protein
LHRLYCRSGRSLSGERNCESEDEQTENDVNSVHEASSNQSTRNSTLLDPGEGKMVPVIEKLIGKVLSGKESL